MIYKYGIFLTFRRVGSWLLMALRQIKIMPVF